jgi:hypothetical protein
MKRAAEQRSEILPGIERKHYLGQNRFKRLIGADSRQRIRDWSDDDFRRFHLSGALMINFRLIEFSKTLVFATHFETVAKLRKKAYFLY